MNIGAAQLPLTKKRSDIRLTAPYPSLYQINTRVFLNDLSRALGRPATLDDIPDKELDRIAQVGYDGCGFSAFGKPEPRGEMSPLRMPSGDGSFGNFCPTAQTTMSVVPVLQSGPTL